MEDRSSFKTEQYKKGILRKIDPIKKYKLIIGFLVLVLIVYGIFSIGVIRYKARFEVNYDEEFYQGFLWRFINEPNSTLEYLSKIEKVSEAQSLSKEEMDEVTMRSLGEVYINELENFYNSYYNRKGQVDDIGNVYSFSVNSFLYETHFEKSADDRYTLGKGRIDQYDNYYIGPKAIAIKKVIKEFVSTHKEYFDEISMKKNKHFIRDGVWRELFINMDKALKKVDMDYDFDENAPKELKLRSVNTILLPREIRNANINNLDTILPGKFKVFDSEMGIYIYYCSSVCGDKFEITKIEKIGDTINFTLDEGNEVEQNENGGVYNIMLIRGLKPGEAKNYKFHLVNTKGEEYKNLDEL